MGRVVRELDRGKVGMGDKAKEMLDINKICIFPKHSFKVKMNILL